MSTTRELFKAVLTSDATLSTLLSGGILDASADREGVSYDDAPKQVGTPLIAPFGVIRWRSNQEQAPIVLDAETRFVELWLYQNQGIDIIDPARARAIKLLNRAILVGASDYKSALITHTGDTLDITADELNNASACVCRFKLNTRRK